MTSGDGGLPPAHSRTPSARTLRKMMLKPDVIAEVIAEPSAACIESSRGL